VAPPSGPHRWGYTPFGTGVAASGQRGGR
jgi:hypothetical protein